MNAQNHKHLLTRQIGLKLLNAQQAYPCRKMNPDVPVVRKNAVCCRESAYGHVRLQPKADIEEKGLYFRF